MAWSTPKTDWATDDAVGTTDLNRIEGNLEHLENLGLLTYHVIDKDCVGSNSASIDLDVDIPSGAWVISAQINADTVVQITSTTPSSGIYVGVSDGVGNSTLILAIKQASALNAIAKNTKDDHLSTEEVGASDVKLYAWNTYSAGVAVQTDAVFTGTVRVKIVYATVTSLPDA